MHSNQNSSSVSYDEFFGPLIIKKNRTESAFFLLSQRQHSGRSSFTTVKTLTTRSVRTISTLGRHNDEIIDSLKINDVRLKKGTFVRHG